VTALWRYFDATGQACGSSREFEGREEAEAWLGDSWRKLTGSGIEQVELVEDEEVAYRMELSEE
jgi:hypothetical protein